MNEFMMIFRNKNNSEHNLSTEQMRAHIKQWQDWIKGIAAQGIFVDGKRLGFQGITLHSDNTITVGPYAEASEILGGYLIIKTEHLDSVLELAKWCPILHRGGCVEVRNIMALPR